MHEVDTENPPRRYDPAAVGLTALSTLGLVDALFNYVWSGNGIHGTEGALLVVISTLLMAIAGYLLAARWARGGYRLTLEILIFLDLLGTGAAAYFLEAWILLGLMVLGLICFFWMVFGGSRPRTSPAPSSGG